MKLIIYINRFQIFSNLIARQLFKLGNQSKESVNSLKYFTEIQTLELLINI